MRLVLVHTQQPNHHFQVYPNFEQVTCKITQLLENIGLCFFNYFVTKNKNKGQMCKSFFFFHIHIIYWNFAKSGPMSEKTQ